MNNNVKIFISVIALLVVGVVISVLLRTSATPPGPGKYDTLAQCIKDSGAVFYGAFWCPHCQAQKKLFGSSASLLPYVECSMPNAKDETQFCVEKGITSYPTWKLADGSVIKNEDYAGISLATLAAKTGCQLPTDEAATQ